MRLVRHAKGIFVSPNSCSSSTHNVKSQRRVLSVNPWPEEVDISVPGLSDRSQNTFLVVGSGAVVLTDIDDPRYACALWINGDDCRDQ